MSGVVAVTNVARLKPELRLAEAISQFEANLSSNEKTAFHAQRANSLQSPPNVNDVMRLTAQIDKSQNAGGRCFGPRFTKFLHGVQQFAALGDVVVGGSQNIIACGVWSVVKISLLAIVNFSSYMENLSLLLMEAGRSYPRHFELATLYPRSKALQSHLNEYFIVVVQICQRLQSYSQSSSFRKITSSLNDTDVKEFQSKLVSWSKSISEEIMCLVAKRTEDEAHSNSTFRTLMTKASKATSRQQSLKTSQLILNLCSEYDYETPWRQIRKMGNTKLFSLDLMYDRWKQNSRYLRSIILFTGKMGSGKSVMLANIIDDLAIHSESTVATTAYFFCKHDLPQSLKARTVIGSLIRQIIRPFKLSILSAIDGEKYDRHIILDYDEMIRIVRHVLPEHHRVYIVLDGLHLCSRSEQDIVVEQLQRINAAASTSICISLRLEPNLESISKRFPDAIVAMPLDNTPDIDAFIQKELEDCLKQQTLILGDPRLILDIHKALSKGSKGMFLWVVLQIKALCAMQTDQEIMDALNDLPEDLSVIYDRILQKCPRSGKQYQKRIFELTVAARRPLTTEELREALSVCPGDTAWSAAKLLNNVYPAMSSCGCLLFVDEEERTVRLVHPSVQQFLFTTYKDHKGLGMTLEECHKSVADILITYLSYGVFGTEVSIARIPEMNVGSAPANIVESTIRSSKGAQNLALKLLKLRKRPSFDASKILAKELSSHKGAKCQEFHLYEYARKSYLTHLAETREMSLPTYDLFHHLLQRGDSPESDLPSASMAYEKSLYSGNVSMIEIALRNLRRFGLAEFFPGPVTTELTNYTRLGFAVCAGLDKVVDVHQRVVGNIAITFQRALEISPCETAFRGRVETVRRLLQSSYADVWLDHICKCGRGLLACSIRGANNEVLKLLLDSGQLDVKAGPFERSAIWEAVARKNKYAMNLLYHHKSLLQDENEAFQLLSLAEGTGDEDFLKFVREWSTCNSLQGYYNRQSGVHNGDDAVKQ